MDKIVIEGVPAYDGEYELDQSYFTNREMNTIKKISGMRGGEIEEAIDAGDNDVFIAIAGIAIRRKTGEEPVWDLLWDAPTGKITVLTDKEQRAKEQQEADALPPLSEPVSSESESENGSSSGLPLSAVSDLPESAPSRTGTSG